MRSSVQAEASWSPALAGSRASSAAGSELAPCVFLLERALGPDVSVGAFERRRVVARCWLAVELRPGLLLAVGLGNNRLPRRFIGVLSVSHGLKSQGLLPVELRLPDLLPVRLFTPLLLDLQLGLPHPLCVGSNDLLGRDARAPFEVGMDGEQGHGS